MISAFGPKAERYGAVLAGRNAVIAEPAHLLPAYLEAMRRREAGQSFYGMLLLEERRTRMVELVAPAILSQIASFDERRGAMDQLGRGDAIVNGKPVRELFTVIDPPLHQLASEFVLLSNAVLVRSHAEYARIHALGGRPRAFERIVAVPALPAIERRRPVRPGIVVWVTDVGAAASAFYAFALSEFHGDVTFVVDDGVIPTGMPGTFVHRTDPRALEALATATAVIATDPADPGYAIAFAQRGYGVVAPMSSGAHEYVRDVVTFDLENGRSIQIAASMAIGRPASLRELPALPPPAPALPSIPVPVEDLPLVSVVIPTYNRRDDIAKCLACLAAQTYPKLEVIVVNDAGEPIDDLVSAYPFATLLNLQENTKAFGALMAGVKITTGELLVFLADDDWLYPDHLTRAVAALETSGASIVHTNGVIRHQKRNPDESVETIGYNAGVFRDTTTPSDSLIATPIVLISCVFRREVFEEIGPMNPIPCADHELQLRAAEKFVFAYVDQTTVEWRLRGESFFKDMDTPAAMKHIFEVLHPRPDRPLIEAMRAQAMVNVAARPPGFMFPPTVNIGTTP